jgi:tetratricopeptide (TPR) repeat protein
MGRALEAKSDFSAAAEAYEAGLAVDPTDTALLRSAAVVRSKLGEHERAIELLTLAIQIEPNNPTNQRILERVQRQLERSAEREAP